MSQFVIEHQKALLTAGFNPGAIDGDWGRKTQLATDAWQRSRGIVIPPWLTVAERELGIAEYPGDANNPRVVEYHRHTSLKASDDEVPWCSAFANYCMDVAGKPKTNSAAASSWLDWGHRLDTPMYGCVAVFSRTGGNHVAFVVGWDKRGNLAVLGGNQSDKVCVHATTTTNLRGYRMI
ncbi:MAG: TIGR02594 family protein [Chthoniobacteraceae bacterium]